MAEEGITWDSPHAVEARQKKEGTFLIDGNEAAALGSIYGGVNMLSWYPITPSSSLAEGIIHWLPQLRETEDGMSTCAVVQAEDELAAAGMVLGSRLGWRQGDDMYLWSRHLVDVRIHWVGILCRSSGRYLGRQQGWALHGAANKNATGGFEPPPERQVTEILNILS